MVRHRESFGNSISNEYQAKEINDRAHADLYGPINVNSDVDPITLFYGELEENIRTAR